MNAVGAALRSWHVPLWPAAALAATAIVYTRGWRVLRRQMPQRFGWARPAAFLGGLGAVGLAVGSPLDAFAGLLLTVHMAQHLLLLMIAPPLLWLGAPAVPLMRGLPQRFAKSALGPFLAWPRLQRTVRGLAHPVVSWSAFALAVIVWHLPGPYQLALRSPGWHQVEHAAFLGAGLLFWWPVVQPWPSVALWPRWRIPLYLFMATLPCDILSAFLAFCGRVVYPFYLATPGRFNMSPLQDQECAGALMWFCSTFIYMIPAVIITIQILSPARTAPTDQAHVALGGLVGRPASADLEVV